jgi:hypothetical protein
MHKDSMGYMMQGRVPTSAKQDSRSRVRTKTRIWDGHSLKELRDGVIDPLQGLDVEYLHTGR